MNEKRRTRISKFLAKHLRHAPAEIGLTLEEGGWVSVAELLHGSSRAGLIVTLEELREVVATNEKQRFAFDESGKKIRANQGHSIEVDLQLPAQIPPAVLYHGSAEQFVLGIKIEGLQKMSRQHVHLSLDVETARRVGARHGKPVIFRVDTAALTKAGYLFYCAANGVWLTDEIPPEFLQLCEGATA